jgi:TonB family protein
MAPVTKDSLEIDSVNSTTASNGEVSGKQTPAAGGHLRADAISLEVPVKVHGSRVVESAPGAATRTEPFEEQTNSMIVFPQGGVLRMSTVVSVGQMLVVTNLKSRQDAICRVVKVRTFTNMQGYVEVEFTHKQPGYWGTRFPSETAPEVSPAATDKSVVAPAASSESSNFTQQNSKPIVAPPSASPVLEMPSQVIAPASKIEPSFVPIGTQEKVQPAASSTSFVPSLEPSKSVAPGRAAQPLPAPIKPARQQTAVPEILIGGATGSGIPGDIESDFPSAQATLRSELSLEELETNSTGEMQGFETGVPSVAVEEDSESPGFPGGFPGSPASLGMFGNLSGGGSLEINSFEEPVSEQGQPAQRGWVPFAAGVLVTLAVMLGAIFYYRSQTPANNATPTQNSPVVPQPLAFQSPTAVNGDASTSETPSRNSALSPVTIEAQTNAQAVTSPSAARSNPPAKSNSRLTTGMMEEALDSHPMATSRQDAGEANAAPSVDAAPSINSASPGSVLGMVPSSNVPVLAVPSARPDAAVKVGGNVKEPRLLSRVMPEYPRVAKDTGVQGEVVVNTTIDQKGNVVNTQVVSGPPLLREPALQALRRWKYEPSTLNGQPIAVQMLVILKFHR